MATRGYIKLYRELQKHWLWENDKPFDKRSAWIDILMMANHTGKKFLLGQELIEIDRGQTVTSELKLMERWGWSKSKVRNFLQLLEKDSMIIKNSDTKKTTLTVCNYSKWQDSETTEEPHRDQSETDAKPREDTNKNVKNVNNEKKKDIEDFFNECWSMYPRKKGKDKISNTVKEKRFKMGDEFKRCIERHNKDVKGRELQHVQYGSTFWNSGYLDYTDENISDSVKAVNAPPREQRIPKFVFYDRDTGELL